MRRSSRVIAVVPAAGSGKRLGSRVKKPFVLLKGKPLAARTLSALESSPAIDRIIVAAEKSCIKNFKDLVRRFGFKKITEIVAGGRTRGESVRNCLDRIGPCYDIVLIHDAARPFIDAGTIARSVKTAEKFGACIVAVPESDTVKVVGKDLSVKKTVDRNKIFRAQTPQVFKRDLIVKAYGGRVKRGVTDDAGLVEQMGMRVKVVKGSCRNIKITTAEDLKLAEVLL